MIDNRRINLFVLIFMNLIFGTFTLLWDNFMLDIIYFCICSIVLIYSRKIKRFIKFFIFYIVCLYIVFFIKLPDNSFFSFIGFISYSNIKMCPIYMIASFIVLDIRTSELIYVLGKLGFSKKVRFACTITLKFIPIYFAEKRIIKNSLKLRGIEISFLNPIKRFEYYIVPTLFRASNIAVEMTESAYTRCAMCTDSMNSIYYKKFKLEDFILIIVLFVFVILWGGGFIDKI